MYKSMTASFHSSLFANAADFEMFMQNELARAQFFPFDQYADMSLVNFHFMGLYYNVM